MVRNLCVVFGDQLNRDAVLFDAFDPAKDRIWMAESDMEASGYVWSHKQRIAIFLSAMRHFAEDCRKDGLPIDYHALDDQKETCSLGSLLSEALEKFSPAAVHVTKPGEWRIERGLRKVCRKFNVPLEIFPDRHFLSDPAAFAEYAQKRKVLRMEYFYRDQRKKAGILMEAGKPVGDTWNFDKENRGHFGKEGPSEPGVGPGIKPDRITRAVLELVEKRFSSHPGSLKDFRWAVTPSDAAKVEDVFVQKHLPQFGQYQDAMWTGQPWLYHSLLSSALNLKLLDPMRLIKRVEKAGKDGDAPLPAVEGFIRQIVGWREYVRNIYWTFMPGYLERNYLDLHGSLPDFYWTGETELVCLREALGQTLRHGYAHHIQRLMVTGLYALLLGVDPRKVHEWYLAVYVDAVEWVELPNTMGMSQYADGGLMASKPYLATGKYIDRMSNYCKTCPCNPAKRTGEKACPFTVLYWDSLQQHKDKLSGNQRMSLQLRNLDRISTEEKKAICQQASRIRKKPADIPS